MAAKSDDKFEIHHRIIDGAHVLNIIPAVKNEGFPEKGIEITEGQWNDLRYHFAIALIAPDHEKLIYVH